MDQLKCLRVFVQVVADGSFAGAARHLDIAPAVATRALAELEAAVAEGTRAGHALGVATEVVGRLDPVVDPEFAGFAENLDRFGELTGADTDRKSVV